MRGPGPANPARRAGPGRLFVLASLQRSTAIPSFILAHQGHKSQISNFNSCQDLWSLYLYCKNYDRQNTASREMNIENPYDVVLGHWWLEVFEKWLPSAANKLQSKSSRKPRRPTNWKPCRWGCPETGPSLLLRGPKLGALQRSSVKRRHLLRHVKRLLRYTRGSSHLAQDCTATPQGCLTHGSG